jgi:hypothetical protein
LSSFINFLPKFIPLMSSLTLQCHQLLLRPLPDSQLCRLRRLLDCPEPGAAYRRPHRVHLIEVIAWNAARLRTPAAGEPASPSRAKAGLGRVIH